MSSALLKPSMSEYVEKPKQPLIPKKIDLLDEIEPRREEMKEPSIEKEAATPIIVE